MLIQSDTPIYPIGVAAKLVNVHPRTLRIYEQHGLVQPIWVGKRRMFSENHITWIRCLRSFIHEEGISIPGLKKLLDCVPCWQVADCPADIHSCCQARVDRALPRMPYLAGDEQDKVRAKEMERALRQQGERIEEKKKRQSSG